MNISIRLKKTVILTVAKLPVLCLSAGLPACLAGEGEKYKSLQDASFGSKSFLHGGQNGGSDKVGRM